jgi:hypothetical protein
MVTGPLSTADVGVAGVAGCAVGFSTVGTVIGAAVGAAGVGVTLLQAANIDPTIAIK